MGDRQWTGIVVISFAAVAIFLASCGGEEEPSERFESVDEETCRSGEKWVGGTSGSPLMHPGRDCIDCHGDHAQAPSFYAAGTVYGGFVEEDDCVGVEGATVRLEDEEGEVVEVETNRSGNFYVSEEETDLETPFRAEVRYEGETRPMDVPVDNPNCNFCHTSERTSGRDPGRIVVPGVEE